MYDAMFNRQRDWLILLARILLMILYVTAGWQKLLGFSGTVGEMAAVGFPLPAVVAVIVIIIELLVGIALVIGVWTRPLALLMAVYTLATAFIGHHYWTMTGAAYGANFINFYKNVSIVGGLLLLCVTGAGKYSIDRS
ncbi:MAG TPA: DoxX family protein [Rhodanobacteraceae bacterium]|nr:DoxX family protein [Rhodanobacteraceae bacterium]